MREGHVSEHALLCPAKPWCFNCHAQAPPTHCRPYARPPRTAAPAGGAPGDAPPQHQPLCRVQLQRLAEEPQVGGHPGTPALGAWRVAAIHPFSAVQCVLCCVQGRAVHCVVLFTRAGQGRAGQGRAGQGRAGRCVVLFTPAVQRRPREALRAPSGRHEGHGWPLCPTPPPIPHPCPQHAHAPSDAPHPAGWPHTCPAARRPCRRPPARAEGRRCCRGPAALA